MTDQRTFTAVCDDCQIPMTFYSTADQYGWAVQHSCTHDGHTVVLASLGVDSFLPSYKDVPPPIVKKVYDEGS